MQVWSDSFHPPVSYTCCYWWKFRLTVGQEFLSFWQGTLAGKETDGYVSVQQTSDPCDSTLSSEFRTQRQTEFLLEAFHLHHRATETRQKLSTLQAETAKSSFGDELTAEAKMCTRRALSSIRNNFKEIQRSLEIWLARILGDLEGMLARDGASRIREYFLSPYASAVRWMVSPSPYNYNRDSLNAHQQAGKTSSSCSVVQPLDLYG